MNVKTPGRPWAFFLACLVPLLAADLVNILLMWHYSVDRGYWPLFLAFMLIVDFLYAGLACLPASLARNDRVSLALSHHVLLGLFLVAHALAFYTAQPDWLAVNNRLLQLTQFQKVVYSGWTPWLIYALFYVALIFRLFKPHRQSRLRSWNTG